MLSMRLRLILRGLLLAERIKCSPRDGHCHRRQLGQSSCGRVESRNKRVDCPHISTSHERAAAKVKAIGSN